jgi:AmmeMemoRadiSam system protein A
MPMSPPLHNSSSELAASELNRTEGGNPGICKSSEQNISTQEFSHDERAQLLRLAHDSIFSVLRGVDVSFESPSAHLAEHRRVFTSLYLQGELRGCVGYVLPNSPLYRAVAETARAAAFSDNRFAPVSREEASLLEIELSILSPPQTIRAEEIAVGRHGLLVSCQGQRGLLLPQVPIEHEWDRVTFLQQTCRKAGLPVDAWQKGATIEAFTAEVFGEKGGQ